MWEYVRALAFVLPFPRRGLAHSIQPPWVSTVKTGHHVTTLKRLFSSVPSLFSVTQSVHSSGSMSPRQGPYRSYTATSSSPSPPPSYNYHLTNDEALPLVRPCIGDCAIVRRRCAVLCQRGVVVFVIIFSLLVLQNAGVLPTFADDIPASEKADIRRQWLREKNEHAIEVQRWEQERSNHSRELCLWDAEREGRVRDRESWKKEVEAERQEWWRKATAERQNWERVRNAERAQHANELAEWERQRGEEERHRKEVMRRRQGVWWSDPWKNGGCYEAGKRSYSAHLYDIPGDLNWLEVCMDMPKKIEGRIFDRPEKCERRVSLSPLLCLRTQG